MKVFLDSRMGLLITTTILEVFIFACYIVILIYFIRFDKFVFLYGIRIFDECNNILYCAWLSGLKCLNTLIYQTKVLGRKYCSNRYLIVAKNALNIQIHLMFDSKINISNKEFVYLLNSLKFIYRYTLF